MAHKTTVDGCTQVMWPHRRLIGMLRTLTVAENLRMPDFVCAM